MRIGIFSESYEPVINGVTVCVRTLRDELDKQGHEVYIFAPEYPGFEDPCAGVFRFPSRPTWFAPEYPLAIPYSPTIKAAFRDLNLDVIHTQTPFMLGILGARWAKEFKIPIVSTNHTQYAKYAHYVSLLPRSVVAWALVGHMRRYYNGCDAVATPSGIARDMLVDYGVRTRIEVIAGGVNDGTVASSNGFREKFGISADAKALLYVGRLAKEKNLDMLLAAFDLVSRESAQAMLVIVGGGPYEQELRARVSSSELRDRIVLVGPMHPSEVKSAYASADLFVWPSVTETQGLAVCEALSAGLPCVAVRAGGTPECVQEGVDSVLTEDDAAAFAEPIRRLLSDDELRGRMAREAARNSARFSTSEMAARFVAFYESVIAERNR